MVLPGEIDVARYIMDLEKTIEKLTIRMKHSGMKTNPWRRNSFFTRILTLPILQPFKPRIDKLQGKGGAPKGHKGATRIHGETDEIIHVSMEKCLNCSHMLASPIRTDKKSIFDIPPPEKVKVTEYVFDVYKCSNCGSEVKAKHLDCPQKGDMGIYLHKHAHAFQPPCRQQGCDILVVL